MARREDWPEALAAKILEWQQIPFVWSETDCVAFIIDVVFAMTGREIVNRSRGTYDSEFGALRGIRNYGDSLAGLVCERFGAPIGVGFAQRGDVLMFENNLGVCVGQSGAFRTPEGLAYIDLMRCAHAWRVD